MDDPRDDTNDDSNEESNIDDDLRDDLEERRRKQREEGNRPARTPRRKQESDGSYPPRGRGTRIGGATFDGHGSLKPGQSVFCRIVEPSPGGYSVVVKHQNRRIPGYLPTQQPLKIGDEIVATFVCVHNKRALLTARFCNEAIEGEKFAAQQSPLMRNMIPLLPSKLPTAIGKQDQQLKRRCDLMPVELESTRETALDIDLKDIDRFCEYITANRHTGVLKAASQARKSRAAILFHRGRVVGCSHTSSTSPHTLPTEQALRKALDLLEAPDTKVELYDLPANIVVPFAALYIGNPVQRNDDLDALTYIKYIRSWLIGQKLTGCLAVETPVATIFAFIYGGQFIWCFDVEQQAYFDFDHLLKAAAQSAEAGVEASVAPKNFNHDERAGCRFERSI